MQNIKLPNIECKLTAISEEVMVSWAKEVLIYVLIHINHKAENHVQNCISGMRFNQIHEVCLRKILLVQNPHDVFNVIEMRYFQQYRILDWTKFLSNMVLQYFL